MTILHIYILETQFVNMEEEKPSVTRLKDFLFLVWDYTSLNARGYTVAVKKKDKMMYKHYVLPLFVKDVKQSNSVVIVLDYDDLYLRVAQDVIELGKDREAHIFYQVLPLANIPEKGRGSANDVKVGRVLFVDIDYKKEVKEKEFEGCKEGEDHALQCYYEENGKVFKVDRPPLSALLNVIGIEPTAVVDSGGGYHFYFKLSQEIDDVSKLISLESKLIEYLKGLGIPADEQVKDLARLLRLPESYNPRTGRLVKVIHRNSEKQYDIEELENKLVVEKAKNNAPQVITIDNYRVLTDGQLIQIKEAIKEAYRPGNRQDLALFLSGWLAQAKIHPLQALKLIKMLYDESHDDDPLKERLATVVYTYKKAGLDVDKSADQIEKEFGIRPYGLESQIDESQIKGKSGVQEILERYYGEEKALDVIRQIEDILKTLSPYRDSVVEIMDYEKQIFAVADLRKLRVVRAKLGKEGLRYKEKVFIGAPTQVEIFSNALGGVTKYKVIWETNTRPKPLEIGPTTVSEILARLSAEGLVVNKRLAEDVLNFILDGFIEKGRAIVKSEVESPGFYLMNGEIFPVAVDVAPTSKEELREALLFLDELVKWYDYVKPKFVKVIKWGVISPFSFIYKQRGQWIRWLFLYGTSGAGKTTIGEIVLHIWGLGAQYVKSGSNIDTPARIGFVLSQSTFPILVNEPANVFNKEDLVEMIKNAIETVVVRGKYIHGSYTEIPSLAPLIFTSNRPLPYDDAILRRFIKLSFTYGEKESIEERKRLFSSTVRPQLHKLKALGKFISYYIIQNQVLKEDWESYAEELLETAYKTAELSVPDWVHLRYEEREEDNTKQEILDYIYRMFINAYTQTFGRISPQTSLYGDENDSLLKRDIIVQVLRNRLIPGVYLKSKGDELYIVFAKKFVDELSSHFLQVTNLKSLAEIFQWEYGQVRVSSDVMFAVTVDLNKFLEALSDKEQVVEE